MRSNPRFMKSLVTESLLTPEDADRLTEKFRGNTFSIMEYLVESQPAQKNELGKLWGDSMDAAYIGLEKVLFEVNTVAKLPEKIARKYNVIPLYQLGEVVTLATADPLDLDTSDNISRIMQKPVSPVFAFPDEIEDAIDVQYQSDNAVEELMNSIASNPLFQDASQITSEKLADLAGTRPFVELSRTLIMLALKQRASDIHLEPQEKSIRVRFRIDGMLLDKMRLDRSILQPLISRLKIMGGMDITERRRPLDGRIKFELSNRSIDIRVSTSPMLFGEKMVMRLLGQVTTHVIPELAELQFSSPIRKALLQVIGTPNGVFFVTGPTGSGKTTTLFSVLKHMNDPAINIMTVEDPIEYILQGVNQLQINKKANLDFAEAMRSFLRQDPDVILIGEIRDLETARIAAQAALTGHLVLATMHTNDALQAVTRLIDIGVEPFLVAPSIIGVMSQRLVRRICNHCKEKYHLSSDEVKQYFSCDENREVFAYRGRGCSECGHTGFQGRVGIYEILVINEPIRRLVAQGASIVEIEKAAYGFGFKNLHYDGIKKALRGMTTIDEVNRVSAIKEGQVLTG